MPKERSILMNAEMVRATLNGSKTQTRRIIKRQPSDPKETFDDGVWSDTNDPVTRYFGCPMGLIGDRLWVRETWQSGDYALNEPRGAVYRATDPTWSDESEGWKWKPSIHMPRGASRLTLEITDVRVQRIQDISESDALSEGVTIKPSAGIASIVAKDTPARMEFWALWTSIYGVESWDYNPWVWAITFKIVNSRK